MLHLEVLNTEGQKSGEIELPEIFQKHVNSDVIHQAVVMYQACLRQGNAHTKERAAVSGGGKKPFRQKGTGRARAGSSRSPLWKGGGTVFGPQKRDFGYTIPKKIRTAALREAINAKLQSNQLFFIEDQKESFAKTKDFALILKNLKINRGKVLAALDGFDPSTERVSRNIARFTIARAQDINAYDIMKNKYLLLSRSAAQIIMERLQK